MEIFENHPELTVAISIKTDGSCRLRSADDTLIDRATNANRKIFSEKIGVDYARVVCADLVHGNTVAIVAGSEAMSVIPQTDGLLTGEPGIFLSVTVADCLPIFLYDPVRKNIGLLHAGWRGLTPLEMGAPLTGLRTGIIQVAIEKMVSELGSDPHDICAMVGPGIGACHFEVGEEVAEKFSQYESYALEERDGKLFLDLKKIAALQLETAGVLSSEIEISAECTYCLEEKYFSYRRDKPPVIEAMMVVFGLKIIL